MKVVEQAILSTDLALYFRKKDRFLETANTGEIDWQEREKKERELIYISMGFFSDWKFMNQTYRKKEPFFPASGVIGEA